MATRPLLPYPSRHSVLEDMPGSGDPGCWMLGSSETS